MIHGPKHLQYICSPLITYLPYWNEIEKLGVPNEKYYFYTHVCSMLQMFNAAVIHCVLMIMPAAFPASLFAFGTSNSQSSSCPDPSFLILRICVLLSLEAPLSLYSVQ